MYNAIARNVLFEYAKLHYQVDRVVVIYFIQDNS